LSNPLILKIVDFYSTLGLMDDLTATINTISDQLVHANEGEARLLNNRLNSAVLVTQEQVHFYRKKIYQLLEGFPKDLRNDRPLLADKSRSSSAGQ
jgi:hypothetical protein